MAISLEEAERERMAAFLNKGRARDTAARLAALRNQHSDDWKKFRDGTGVASTSGQVAKTTQSTGRVAIPDLVSRPSVLSGKRAGSTRAGPRTRFGDGDGSWWDRWLGFEPPRVSSYSNGFVAPLNGFKRERMVAREGKWVDDPAHHKRLMPKREPSVVQAAFANTMLRKPKDLEESDDSLDESQGSASSDESDEVPLPPGAGAPGGAHLVSPVRSFRAGPGGTTSPGMEAALNMARAPATGRRPGSRTRSLPPLSPLTPAGQALMSSTTPLHPAGNAAASFGAPTSARLKPDAKPPRFGHLADSLRTNTRGQRPRSASFVPTDVLSMLQQLQPPSGASDAGDSDSDSTDKTSSSEEQLDVEEAHERALTRRFVGSRARWKLYHKYRNVDKTFGSEHVRGQTSLARMCVLRWLVCGCCGWRGCVDAAHSTPDHTCWHRHGTHTILRISSLGLWRTSGGPRPWKNWTRRRLLVSGSRHTGSRAPLARLHLV